MRKIFLAVGFVLLWAACALTGCSKAGRVQRALNVLDDNRKEAARYCSENFQPDIKTEFLPGKTDTITETKTETKFVEVECPPGTVTTKVKTEVKIEYRDRTIYKTDTIREKVRDKAREYVLEAENSDLMVTAAAYKGEAEKWQGRAKKRARNQIVLIGLLVLCAGWFTRKLWMPILGRL